MNFKLIVSISIKYSVLTFLIGFILGTIRVLFLIPRLGETLSVAIELPIILTFSWMVFRHLTKNTINTIKLIELMSIGSISLLLLFAFEILLTILVFQGSLNDFFNKLLTLHGIIGLLGQIAFSLIPTLIFIKDKK